MNGETPVSPSLSMTVTKAKIRQAHICILLPDIDKLCPPLLFSLSLSLSLSLSQIIELEEDEPKLFTKTIQQKKRKERKEKAVHYKD